MFLVYRVKAKYAFILLFHRYTTDYKVITSKLSLEEFFRYFSLLKSNSQMDPVLYSLLYVNYLVPVEFQTNILNYYVFINHFN